MPHFQHPLPLSVYVHMPWCVRKCPYCDFNSHTAEGALPERAYVEALIADLDEELPSVWGRSIVSVFIGGGTPSLLSPEALDELLGAMRARLPFRPDIEVTLEANPGAAERGKFAEFHALGINRLSLGVQSFNSGQLERLGRIHDGLQAREATEAARKAGFENLNLDLMFGLPGQSLAEARSDLEQAIALEPTHISYYQLTLEPHTPFYRQPPRLPKEETVAQMQEQGEMTLAAAGYAHYEVSAFARPNRQCRHNRNYWQFGDYLGLGAGAHGKRTDAAAGRVLRRWKVRHPNSYLTSRNRVAGESVLGEQDLAFEFMMNALRLNEGFETRLFDERTGLPLSVLEASLRDAEARGLILRGDDRIRPTPLGRRFLNDLLQLMLPEPQADE